MLREVRFRAAPGEFIALFGPSGVGKTTTLRIVLGLDTAFTGRVRRGRGRIGVVFQEPRLAPWLNVADNLRLVATDGVPAPDIPTLLDEVGLSGGGGHMPRELSLGMARRAALARALAVTPDLLVLDEPFASTDPQLGASLATMTARWARRRGATVLLATHDLDQALAVADRVLVLFGHPATLAADLAVPEATDGAAVALMRETLLLRFPFLGTGEDRPAASP
ncbi:ATP-binding cassette domain-containing protein [Limobrevibacterium gyesilva]|uniref:ATP-binding cassette domain-containing protein n=1 Tax=Limobrevibacterium gyesilva TaxID=2991712 RepID=UPI002227F50C